MTTSSIDFADLARSISAAARALKLVAPSFRTPPTHPTAARTIRSNMHGHVTVHVRIAGRSMDDVAADMIDGVIAANRLQGMRATRARLDLAAASVVGA